MASGPRIVDIIVDSQLGGTDATSPKWRVHRLPLHAGNNSFNTLEELLNFLASDQDSIRATSLTLDCEILVHHTASSLVDLGWVALAWIYANGDMPTAQGSTYLGCGPEYAFSALMTGNSRKGIFSRIRTTVPRHEHYPATTYERQVGRISVSWKFPDTGGRLFTDDEGRDAPGYRTYLGFAYGSGNSIIGDATNAMYVNIRGYVQLRCIQKALSTNITLKDLLAEAD